MIRIPWIRIRNTAGSKNVYEWPIIVSTLSDGQDKLPSVHLRGAGRGGQDAGHGLRAPDQAHCGAGMVPPPGLMMLAQGQEFL